jgi:hypothetical protein
MDIEVALQSGIDIEGVGAVPFGMRADEMVSLLGEPDSLYNGQHEYLRFGCFIDVKPESPNNPNNRNVAAVVDAVEFWNDGEANIASVRLWDVDVLRSPGLWVKAFLESKNAATPVDGWFVNLDVFVSGGNPKYAYEEIERHRVEGSFADVKDMLREELMKATFLTSFGFAQKGYCADGLAELERLTKA